VPWCLEKNSNQTIGHFHAIGQLLVIFPMNNKWEKLYKILILLLKYLQKKIAAATWNELIFKYKQFVEKVLLC